MRCARVRRELSAFLDGELTPDEMEAIRQHIASCERCRREMESLRAVVLAVRKLPRPKAPDGLREEVLSRIEQRPPVRREVSRWRAIWPAAAALVIALVLSFVWPSYQRKYHRMVHAPATETVRRKLRAVRPSARPELKALEGEKAVAAAPVPRPAGGAENTLVVFTDDPAAAFDRVAAYARGKGLSAPKGAASPPHAVVLFLTEAEREELEEVLARAGLRLGRPEAPPRIETNDIAVFKRPAMRGPEAGVRAKALRHEASDMAVGAQAVRKAPLRRVMIIFRPVGEER